MINKCIKCGNWTDDGSSRIINDNGEIHLGDWLCIDCMTEELINADNPQVPNPQSQDNNAPSSLPQDFSQTNTDLNITTLLTLCTLSKCADMYGYEIARTIQNNSYGSINLQERTLYHILYRLLKDNYISISREVPIKNRVRVYYRIEDKGKKYMNELVKNYLNSTHSICAFLGYDIIYRKQ